MAFGGSLGVHPDTVLRPARSNERPSGIVLFNLLVDQRLHPSGLDQPPLGVRRRERVPVLDVHLDEPVGQVKVRRVPLCRSPAAVNEDRNHEEQVRERVPDRLVDELCKLGEVRQGRLLRRRLGLVRRQELGKLGREEDGAVPVGLEVNANVVPLSGVVEVLDARRNAGDRESLRERAQIRQKVGLSQSRKARIGLRQKRRDPPPEGTLLSYRLRTPSARPQRPPLPRRLPDC